MLSPSFDAEMLLNYNTNFCFFIHLLKLKLLFDSFELLQFHSTFLRNIIDIFFFSLPRLFQDSIRKTWLRLNQREMRSDVDAASRSNWLDWNLLRLNGKWHFNGQVFLYPPFHFVAFEIPSLPVSPQWQKSRRLRRKTFKISATGKTWQQCVTGDIHFRFTIVLPILPLESAILNPLDSGKLPFFFYLSIYLAFCSIIIIIYLYYLVICYLHFG